MNTNKIFLAVALGLSVNVQANANSDDEGFAAFFSEITGESAEKKTESRSTTINNTFESRQNVGAISISNPNNLASKVKNQTVSDKEEAALSETINEALKKGKLTKSKGLDGLYIQNIPQTSAISFNKKLQILPYNSEMVFHEGKQIFDRSELPNGTPFTRCSLMFKPFGVGRNIKKDDNFLITQIAADTRTDPQDNSKTKHEIVIKLKNEHLNMLYCESTEKDKPFTIGDVKYQFGGIVQFKLRDFIDI